MKKGFVGVFAILGVICLFVAATILFNTVLIKKENKTEATPSGIPVDANIADQTADWGIYTNKQFHYSFKNPPNIYVHDCLLLDFYCGEELSYDAHAGESNSIGSSMAFSDPSCSYTAKQEESIILRRASLAAEDSLPGVKTCQDSHLQVVDEKNTDTSTRLPYTFYLKYYDGTKVGPYYAFFFSKSINEVDNNKIPVTYYGILWSPNQLKPLTPDNLLLFNQIVSTFKFTN